MCTISNVNSNKPRRMIQPCNDNNYHITAHICHIAPVPTNKGYYMLQDKGATKNKAHGHNALGIRKQSNINYNLGPQRSHKTWSKMHQNIKYKAIKQYLILAPISFHMYKGLANVLPNG